MTRIKVKELAAARSGDKGDSTNVGVLAKDERAFEILKRELTAERVQRHFAAICTGPVERFELPNLLAFNFVLQHSLGGGGSSTLRTDAQGKTHGLGLLEMEIDA